MSTASRIQAARPGVATSSRPRALVLWLWQVGIGDAERVGAEASSLGELFAVLSRRGVRVPNGFASTVDAHAAYLDSDVPPTAWSALPRGLDRLGVTLEHEATLRRALGAIFGAKAPAEVVGLQERCAAARTLCLATPVPDDVRRALFSAYDALWGAGEPAAVAVRSSVWREDAMDASCGGPCESLLAVHGHEAVADAWRRCAAGAFSEHAVAKRLRHGRDPRDAAVSVVVTPTVRADLASSGVVLTVDPDSRNDDFVHVTASHGLGAPVGRGSESPDTFLVWKEGLRRGTPAIVGRVPGRRAHERVCARGVTTTAVPAVDRSERPAWSLDDDDVLALARTALVAEEHCGRPMDLEWVKDGATGEIHLVQARPASVHVEAPSQARLPSDGVGLARLEVILASQVGIHPLALALHQELVAFADTDDVPPGLERVEPALRAMGGDGARALVDAIDVRTRAYPAKKSFLVERIREAVARICAAFHPRPVRVRLSDLKSNEYRALLGGVVFEPKEENPMIAWRGAARLVDPRFRPAFDLECEALAQVRWEMGLDNLQIMVPFCRTPEEGRRVVDLLARYRLAPGHGVPLFLTVALPANVVEADRFIDAMGLSGGSVCIDDLVQTVYALSRNDLDQYGAGLDADSPAVRWVVAEAVRRFVARGLEIGICGRGVPDHGGPSGSLLAECGVETIRVTPDALSDVRSAVTRVETSSARARLAGR